MTPVRVGRCVRRHHHHKEFVWCRRCRKVLLGCPKRDTALPEDPRCALVDTADEKHTISSLGEDIHYVARGWQLIQLETDLVDKVILLFLLPLPICCTSFIRSRLVVWKMSGQ